MRNIVAFAELLYVVSNFEKGRVKSSGFWSRKYVESLKSSIEIMALLTNLISTNKAISQDQMRFLCKFIHVNNGIIFSNEGNTKILLNEDDECAFSSDDYENVTKLMNDIILEIQYLLSVKNENYKTKISYLLRAFHNLPRVFLVSNHATVFDLDIQPITQQEAIQYAFSYLSLKDKER